MTVLQKLQKYAVCEFTLVLDASGTARFRCAGIGGNFRERHVIVLPSVHHHCIAAWFEEFDTANRDLTVYILVQR